MVAENTRFNAIAYIYIMFIEGAPVLHMIDDTTHSSAGQFVEPLTTESFRETILTLRANVYTVLLNALVFDDGSHFRDAFVEICEIHDFE